MGKGFLTKRKPAKETRFKTFPNYRAKMGHPDSF